MSPPEEASNDALGRARERFAARAWGEAQAAFAEADRGSGLAVDDLWRWSWAASLAGGPLAGLEVLERIYESQVTREARQACRAAFWLSFRLLHLGETSRGQGCCTWARPAAGKAGSRAPNVASNA